MSPHVIRLRGPWEYEPLAPSVQLPAGRVKLPVDWSDLPGRDACGRVRFRRRFHRPSGLDPRQRVVVVVQHVPVGSSVALDGRPLGNMRDTGPTEFDITRLLHDSNELSLEVERPQADFRGSFGDVRLEIHQ